MIRRILGSLALATLLACLLLAPAVAGGRLLGEPTVDAFGSWWFQWWAERTVATGGGFDHTDLLFFPWGKDVLRHTGGNLLDVLLLAPFRAALGGAVAWNLLAFAALLTNGAAAGAWAARRGASIAGVAAATALVTLHPYPLHELAMGRPTQAILAPLLLALATAEAAFRERAASRDTPEQPFQGRHLQEQPPPGDPSAARRSRGAAVLSGLLLGLSGWFYWYYALFGAIAVVLLSGGRPRNLVPLLVVAGTALLVTLSGLLPLLEALRDGAVPAMLPEALLRGDPSAFASLEGAPVRLSVLRASGDATFLDGRGLASEGMILGISSALPLLLVRGPWRLVVFVAALLAWGPLLGGLPNPLYAAFALLPPVSRLYWPSRLASLLVVAAAAGVVHVSSRSPARVQGGILAAVLLFLPGEALYREALPLGSWSPEVSPLWQCIDGRGLDGGAVLEVPYGVDQWPLVEQTVHGLPIFGGMHERSPSLVPEAHQALRRENTWLAALMAVTRNPQEVPPWTLSDRDAIGALGYRFVAVRLDVLRKEPELLRITTRRLPGLLGPALREDRDLALFSPWGGIVDCQENRTGGPPAR